DKAVRFLLDHWKTRRPLGPCEFGIGTLFMQIEYPFLRYNLFFYVYVLSFYKAARKNAAFQRALHTLESKLANDRIVVENPNRKLAQFAFCKKGQPSRLATQRYREIQENFSA
ncbi:MAG: prenyltransferase, partial [Phycisphaerae bacterium]